MDVLNNGFLTFINRIDTRLDRLYEVIVKQDEHIMVVERVAVLEREVGEIKRRIAA
jgi:hypothetical protein